MEEEKIIQILESVGIHKNESIIYLDLIKAGGSTAHEISNRTHIHRPNVYDTLEKLMKKAIITQSIKDNKKIFYPVKPENLLEYLKHKEDELKRIIPELEKVHSKPKELRKVSMSEGIGAIRILLDSLLEMNQPIYAYGISKRAIEGLGEGFLNEFHKKRVSKKIPIRSIYNKDLEELAKRENKLNHSEMRCLPPEYDSKVITNICGNKIIIFFWAEPICALVIENQEIVDAYKKYFEILWEKAKIAI